MEVSTNSLPVVVKHDNLMDQGNITFSYAAIIGMISGLGKFILLQVTSTPDFGTALFKAALTAFVCALSGALAKYLFDIAIKPAAIWLYRQAQNLFLTSKNNCQS